MEKFKDIRDKILNNDNSPELRLKTMEELLTNIYFSAFTRKINSIDFMASIYIKSKKVYTLNRSVFGMVFIVKGKLYFLVTPSFFDGKNVDEVSGIIAHELLHVFLGHMIRTKTYIDMKMKNGYNQKDIKKLKYITNQVQDLLIDTSLDSIHHRYDLTEFNNEFDGNFNSEILNKDFEEITDILLEHINNLPEDKKLKLDTKINILSNNGLNINNSMNITDLLEQIKEQLENTVNDDKYDEDSDKTENALDLLESLNENIFNDGDLRYDLKESNIENIINDINRLINELQSSIVKEANENLMEYIQRQTLEMIDNMRSRGTGSSKISSLLNNVENFYKPKIKYTNYLKPSLVGKYASNIYKENPVRYSRRYGQARLEIKSRKKKPKPKLFICIDVSGSMSNESVSEIIEDVKKIIKTLYVVAYVYFFDFEMLNTEPIILDDAKDVYEALKDRPGDGGTSFEPMFNLLNNKSNLDSSVVLFTDGYGESIINGHEKVYFKDLTVVLNDKEDKFSIENRNIIRKTSILYRWS